MRQSSRDINELAHRTRMEISELAQKMEVKYPNWQDGRLILEGVQGGS